MKIQIKRGVNANISTLSLSEGEPAFVTDTGQFYIGDGSNNVLINPIEKPTGLDTQSSYTKVSVNEFGQVISQETLNSSDIPNLTTDKITNLGSSATLNVGTSAGEIPVLNETGVLTSSILPSPLLRNYIVAYYANTQVSVATNEVIPFDTSSSNGTAITLDANGYLEFNESGTYLIGYHVSSASSEALTSLAFSSGTTLPGTLSRSTAPLPNPYVSTFAITFYSVTATQKIGVLNNGSINLVLPSQSSNLFALKL